MSMTVSDLIEHVIGARTGAAIGAVAVTSYLAARAAGRATRADHAGAAGGAGRGHGESTRLRWTKRRRPHGSAVTLIQRFGYAANLNVQPKCPRHTSDCLVWNRGA
jgi:hypothetical protein